MRWNGTLWAPYSLLALVHVLAQVFGSYWPAVVSKALLMPVLAATFLLATRNAPRETRWRTLTVVALGCCWIGDVVLEVPGGFGVGMTAFFAGHVAYVTVYWRLLRGRGIRRLRWVALAYVAWWLGLFALFAPAIGWLVVPFAVYGLALGANAAVACGVDRCTAIGALAFLVSDTLIAVGEFLHRLPAHDVVVMVTYVAGQGLIAYGLVRRSRALDQLDEHATGVLRVHEVDP